ncbi:diguanylate cyclase [Thalassospiraceae bacterium SW-3-3]|nr:diguanylate cyclase [Thalassospiraceae bacterium SW-3-3]
MLSRPMIFSMFFMIFIFSLALFLSFRNIYAEFSRYEKTYLQSRADYISLGIGRVIEHTVQTLNRVDGILAVYPEGFNGNNRYINTLLTRLDNASKSIEGIFVVGPDGVVKTHSSSIVFDDPVVVDEPFVGNHFPAGMVSDRVFVGEGVTNSQTGKSYIPVSAAVMNGSTIQALVVAFVDAEYLVNLLYPGTVYSGQTARLSSEAGTLIYCLGKPSYGPQVSCQPDSDARKDVFSSVVLKWVLPEGYQSTVHSSVEPGNLSVTLYESVNTIFETSIGVISKMGFVILIAAVAFGICLWVIWYQTQSWRKNETRWKRKSRRLLQLAMTDPLTGLGNRRAFEMEARRIAQESAKNGAPYGVMLIDADHFKKVNDDFGHATGDLVLRELAKMLKSNIRETDIAGRIGGEEFAVISPDISPDGLNRLGRRILLKTRMLTVESEEGDVSPTVSVGIVHVPGGSTHHDIFDLLSKADDALYSAKEAGRDCLKTEKM